jgi:hypothetical protein
MRKKGTDEKERDRNRPKNPSEDGRLWLKHVKDK